MQLSFTQCSRSVGAAHPEREMFHVTVSRPTGYRIHTLSQTYTKQLKGNVSSLHGSLIWLRCCGCQPITWEVCHTYTSDSVLSPLKLAQCTPLPPPSEAHPYTSLESISTVLHCLLLCCGNCDTSVESGYTWPHVLPAETWTLDAAEQRVLWLGGKPDIR